MILLNDGESGAGVTMPTGIEVDFGIQITLTHLMNLDDTWKARTNGTVLGMAVGDLSANELTLTNELPLDMGGTHTDTVALRQTVLMTMSGSSRRFELTRLSQTTQY